MNTTEKKIYQSRWGFHPISYEASKKLRFINGVFAKEQHKAAAYVRWQNKMEHNRVVKERRKPDGKRVPVLDSEGKPIPIPEPVVNPLFHTVYPFEKKEYWSVPSRYKSTGLGEDFLHASRIARKPVPTPEDVKEFPITEEEIERLYQALK